MILITGASGFVGQALHARLLRDDRPTRAVARTPAKGCMPVAAIDGATDWSEPLRDVEVVVHLAARVHVMREAAVDPLRAFRIVNVEATENLARQAARFGVRRFVYVSSIKVNGDLTRSGHAFRADDIAAPSDAYGVSKWEAEQALKRIGEETGLEVVIIRPPLVYGPGVKANFRSMMRWLARGVPLPLGAIHNRRTLVALDNLVDLIVTCIEHPNAPGQVFLAGDGEDLSTTDLLRRLARAMGVPARLVPVPLFMLEAAAALLGKRAVARRLLGNLVIDTSETRRLLGWVPPVSVDEGLRRAARGFLEHWRP